MPAAVAACAAALAAAAGLWLGRGGAPVERSSPALFGRAPAAPLVGRPAPDFTLPVLSGGPRGGGGRLSLHSLRGRPVVLNFWASWCAPCREETPLLARLSRTYGPRGVAFVGVDVEDNAADARRFIGRNHVGYTVVASADEKVTASYAVPGLPTTVFIDRSGVIRDRQVGGFVGRDGERALTDELDRLLGSAR